MMKEVALLVGGAGMMALILTPEAQTAELEAQPKDKPVHSQPKSTNIVTDEDAYWEYDSEDADDIAFGEPMVDPDAGATQHSKTMFLKAPKKAAAAKGKSSWKQEYPKPLD